MDFTYCGFGICIRRTHREPTRSNRNASGGPVGPQPAGLIIFSVHDGSRNGSPTDNNVKCM